MKTNKTKNTTQKTKKDEQHKPYQKPGVNPGEGQAFPSYKTPTVLLIYTVKSDKSLGSDRGKKTST